MEAVMFLEYGNRHVVIIVRAQRRLLHVINTSHLCQVPAVVTLTFDVEVVCLMCS
jgi:hypothetical protein